MSLPGFHLYISPLQVLQFSSLIWPTDFVTSDVVRNGCKNCNCKKSKCLKLYVKLFVLVVATYTALIHSFITLYYVCSYGKCFAAQSYCLDSCGCKDCSNKPEYNDSVLNVIATQEALFRNSKANYYTSSYISKTKDVIAIYIYIYI